MSDRATSTPNPLDQPPPPWWDVLAVPERLPLTVMVISFAAVGLWDHERGLTLWRNYALTGVIGTTIVGYFFWSGRLLIPRLAFWIGYAAMMLHFGGGSLGAADRGPGPFCLFGLEPGQGLCADGINGMYHVHAWWDKLTHGLGGVGLAMGIGIGWRRVASYRGYVVSQRMEYWLAFSTSLAWMTAFEVYEFFGKEWFGTIDQGGYANTAADLVSDTVGSLVGAWLAVHNERWPRHVQHARILPRRADLAVLWHQLDEQQAPKVGTGSGGQASIDGIGAVVRGRPLEAPSPWPWPEPVFWMQAISLPVTVGAFLVMADFLLLGGTVMERDYDRLGEFLRLLCGAAVLIFAGTVFAGRRGWLPQASEDAFRATSRELAGVVSEAE